MSVERQAFGGTPFGRTGQGEAVERIALRSGKLRAEILTRGATLAALFAPDRAGRPGDVVLGFEDLAGYERSAAYVGCVVGRVANRIAGSRFPLDGREIRLTPNEGPNHLHGGARGLDRAVFEVAAIAPDALTLRTLSPDGDQGYPGRLDVEVHYALEQGDTLALRLVARCDRPTPVNLSHHAYWNLSGAPAAEIRDHELTTPASRRVETDGELLPTGRIVAVEGTPWDFRAAAALGPRIDAKGSGFDGHLVLPDAPAPGLRHAATLHHPASGRTLELRTTQPGFQLYTGNPLGGERDAYTGVCLEPQHPPDAVNQPGFPSVVLRPGETYRQTSRFRFSAS